MAFDPKNLRGKIVLLSPALIAQKKGVNPQTVLNAIEDGSLQVAAYIIGPNGRLVAQGVSPDVAESWRPRGRGRPRARSMDDIIAVEERSSLPA